MFERSFCIYIIKVPKGRRVTLEILKGNSIALSCEVSKKAHEENMLIENLVVSVNFLIYPTVNLFLI